MAITSGGPQASGICGHWDMNGRAVAIERFYASASRLRVLMSDVALLFAQANPA